MNMHIVFSQCDSAYTHIDSLPSNVNILFGDCCFYNEDVSALNDLIVDNNLIYDSPLHLGTPVMVQRST